MVVNQILDHENFDYTKREELMALTNRKQSYSRTSACGERKKIALRQLSNYAHSMFS